MAYPDSTGRTQADLFIPELWSDEVVAAYKANLVLAALVTMFNHQGKKGDRLNIPAPTRGTASLKAENTLVDPIQNVEGDINIDIATHYEYSRLIEDIVSVQALDSLRQFYTDDAGYALATQVDTSLVQQGRSLNGGAGDNTYNPGGVIGSTGAAFNGTNEAALADAGIRSVVQDLDDANVPQRDRVLIIPPVAKNSLLGESRFTEQAFVGEVGMANSIRNGRVGNIYGVEVFVSTNCDTAAGGERVCLMMHRSAMALVMQLDIRVQTQYKAEYLADLLVADTIYGNGELRNDAGIPIIVPA